MGFNWTPEHVERLKEFAKQALPVRVLADEFGVTRNAIIGKAARVGIELLYVKPRRPGSVVITRSRNTPFRGQSNKSQPLPARVSSPNSRDLEVVQLRENDCRFVVTDDHPMLFCGAPKQADSSYCPHHHEVCHVNRMDPRSRQHASSHVARRCID